MMRVIVSTDHGEIARIAAMHGAEVPFRQPMKFAENLVVDFPVIQHALDGLRETGTICQMMLFSWDQPPHFVQSG